MDKVTSINEIQEKIQSIKKRSKGIILTNYYLDIPKHSSWIAKEDFFVWGTIDCVFFFKKKYSFYYLFFIGLDEKSIQNSFSQCPFKNEKLIIDIIGRADDGLKKIWEEIGFMQYNSLFRMVRIGIPSFTKIDKHIMQASFEDLIEIKKVLDKNFDSISEQIPDIEDLREILHSGGILVYKIYNSIGGFIIYNLSGMTLYLRYWFVSPEYRNMRIGSKLFNAFLEKGCLTKRQILWVLATNKNAITRYEHYGFTYENLYDYILINNYERKNNKHS